MLLWTRHSPKSAAGASEIHPGFQHFWFGRRRVRADRRFGYWTSFLALTLWFCRGSFSKRSSESCSIRGYKRDTGLQPSKQRVLRRVADAADLVEPVIDRPVILSDPADDSVLYTAVDGRADILCTRNIRHFASAEVLGFCAERGIRVMTDLEALRHLL